MSASAQRFSTTVYACVRARVCVWEPQRHGQTYPWPWQPSLLETSRCRRPSRRSLSSAVKESGSSTFYEREEEDRGRGENDLVDKEQRSINVLTLLTPLTPTAYFATCVCDIRRWVGVGGLNETCKGNETRQSEGDGR